jgi:hypothetical protein
MNPELVFKSRLVISNLDPACVLYKTYCLVGLVDGDFKHRNTFTVPLKPCKLHLLGGWSELERVRQETHLYT